MATINLGQATEIVPQLKELVTLIQMKRPLYEFHATNFRNAVSDETGSITKWATGFEVTQDADRVGEIRYQEAAGRRQSDGTYPDAYVIRSEHIQKERGARDTIVTTNTTTALKHVIKAFAPPTIGQMCARLISRVRDEFDNHDYRWRSSLSQVSSYFGNDIHEWIIESHLQGKVLPMPATCKVDENQMHMYYRYIAGKSLKAVSKYNSGKGSDRSGFVVKVLADNTIRAVSFMYDARHTYEENNIPLMRYRNYEEMPIRMQEQIAVLKIAEENDPIQDIGVKFEDNIMYIVG
jgi:hypothetical protein